MQVVVKLWLEWFIGYTHERKLINHEAKWLISFLQKLCNNLTVQLATFDLTNLTMIVVKVHIQYSLQRYTSKITDTLENYPN